ncbi:hypothetical protein PGTUg99_013174 [Puccinia graminis f. sp. tritici]|uniref:Uncharacterized protein n=1 Tax=Puccinia graminis f. sp. tritici TaxID=56615 RepID=A0A5B0N938_PUCGR|nr:hypothetical protein PGTUg99_013174 [Puccinia graminis f. sp. tritici]
MTFLLLLIISLYPIPTTLGAFIDKAVEKRIEGSNHIHHLCDRMPTPLEPAKETTDNPRFPPTDSLQALTLAGDDLPKEPLNHSLLVGSTSTAPPISSKEKTENLKVRENWKTNEGKLSAFLQ